MKPSNGWLTLEKSASASLTERKSEFIASVSPVHSEEEALAFIASVRKRYADARHNVYAYLLREGNTSRFSDDGEPHGTAGLPILDVLRGEGLTDTAIVVTRYFGGILLGTGGLVRAYSQSARLALDAAGRTQIVRLTVFSLRVSYADLRRVESLLAACPISRLDAVYTDDVLLTFAMREEEYEPLASALSERTNGRAILELLETRYGCPPV